MRRAVLLAACVMAIAFVAAACNGAEQRGHQLYAERGCAVCHGTGGRGDGPAAKRLDAPPLDLTDARAYKAGSSQDQIAASIRNGSGAMPPFRDLTGPEAADIAAWIVSLQQSGAR